MTTTYSAFFSSGLLAPSASNAYSHRIDSSPPVDALEDVSDVEDAVSRFSTNNADFPKRTTSSNFNSKSSQPTLRKRRSSVSLNVNTSPVARLRSPTRAVESAFSLHRHLHHTQATPSKSRSRSGSVTGNGEFASIGTSLVGRMRSASVGTALKPRRFVRRVPTNPLPPPSVPLPPLPPLPPKTPQRVHGRSFSLAPGTTRAGNRYGPNTALPPVPATPPDIAVDSPRTPLGVIQDTYQYIAMEED